MSEDRKRHQRLGGTSGLQSPHLRDGTGWEIGLEAIVEHILPGGGNQIVRSFRHAQTLTWRSSDLPIRLVRQILCALADDFTDVGLLRHRRHLWVVCNLQPVIPTNRLQSGPVLAHQDNQGQENGFKRDDHETRSYAPQ